MKPFRYRFLQTGDLHVGKGRSSWGEAEALDRADKLFDRLYAIARAEKCHAVLITGDVFDTKSVTISERDLVTEKLFKYAGRDGIETFVISGNHDLTKAGESNLDYLAVISNSREIPKLHVAPADKAEFWNTPYPKLQIAGVPVGLSETQEGVEGVVKSLDPDMQYIFMGHGTVGGSLRNDANWRPEAAKDANRLNLGKVAPHAPNVVWWAYGDIHKRQPLPGLPETAKGWYAGSPIQMDFGEKADRGVLVVALDCEYPNGNWKYVGKRYIRVDEPEAGFAELVRVIKEEQLDSVPEKALLQLAPNLVLSAERRAQVVSKFRVVDDRTIPISDSATDTQAVTTGTMQVFDPLLADLNVVEQEVLTDLPSASEPQVLEEAKKVVGLAVERYRNRTFVA